MRSAGGASGGRLGGEQELWRKDMAGGAVSGMSGLLHRLNSAWLLLALFLCAVPRVFLLLDNGSFTCLLFLLLLFPAGLLTNHVLCPLQGATLVALLLRLL